MGVIRIKVQDFINLHSPTIGTYPWHNYCEIIIDNHGEIFEAVPSHEQYLMKMLTEDDRKTREYELLESDMSISPLSFICEWKQCCSVWYNSIMGYIGMTMNSDIMSVLNTLAIHKIISENVLSNIEIAHDLSSSKFTHGDMDEDEYFNLMDEIKKFNRRNKNAR